MCQQMIVIAMECVQIAYAVTEVGVIIICILTTLHA